MHIIQTTELADEIISDVIARDCVLWLTTLSLSTQEDLETHLSLVNGPWRAVYVESASADFTKALIKRSENMGGTDEFGVFSHLIASDPVALVLQRRAKPIFFLNGRDDSSGADGAHLPKRSTDRRRLNMTARLRDLEPRRVIVVGTNSETAIEDLADLWNLEFRSLLTIVTTDAIAINSASERLQDAVGLNIVQWVRQLVDDFAAALTRRLTQLAIQTNLLLFVQIPGGIKFEIDLTIAELAEQPISDLCDFIRVSDILSVSPDDLRNEEFRQFFTRNQFSWRPYAAGLPWRPELAAERDFIKRLHAQLTEPPSSVQLFSVVSEPGAGGTTQASALALTAARAGFPVLLAKQQGPTPNALELTGFLYRAIAEISRRAADLGFEDAGEPVWVVVLDVQHIGNAFDELERFCAELARSGRKIAILKVASSDAPIEPPASIPHHEIIHVGHSLDIDEVAALGKHVNSFLRRFGEDKSPDDWIRFWHNHRPDIDTGIASFWIALEFWLGGFLKLGESIQSWTLRQFRALDGKVEIQKAVLEIASFAIERKAIPERLLVPLIMPKVPWAYALETARRDAPGLGLVQAETFPAGRSWAIAHDVLARYLLNGIWTDRLLCESLSISFYEDPIALRLAMISAVCSRSSVGEEFSRPFAVALATHILKLDESYGNAEFFKHWRQVIEILDSVPQVVRVSSRTFNHHLAISRRRITQGELFQIDDQEKTMLLKRAAHDIEFALEHIESTPDDEGNLNLLNSLALIYQDLGDLARREGSHDELAKFLAKSDGATSRAFRENPNSPYVLETAAKNLLGQRLASKDPSEKVEAAAKALSFVFQASRLDSAVSRRMKLGQLAALAVRALRENNAVNIIDKLCSQGSSYGYIAKAWNLLPMTNDDDAPLVLDSVDAGLAGKALGILAEAPSRDWLLVRLMYDLVVLAEDRDFQKQLRLLDELAAIKGYQLSLQQMLERAVLLYFSGQHSAANDEFRSLRPKIKEAQVVIFVPPRLRWLVTPDRSRRAVCTAQVVDSSASARAMARVRELGGNVSPFNPQEFGKARMAPNEQFKCQVTFSAMGPFLKPIEASVK